MRAMIAIQDLEDGNLEVNAHLFATTEELKCGVSETAASLLFDYLETAIETWKANNGLASIQKTVEPNPNQTVKH